MPVEVVVCQGFSVSSSAAINVINAQKLYVLDSATIAQHFSIAVMRQYINPLLAILLTYSLSVLFFPISFILGHLVGIFVLPFFDVTETFFVVLVRHNPSDCVIIPIYHTIGEIFQNL